MVSGGLISAFRARETGFTSVEKLKPKLEERCLILFLALNLPEIHKTLAAEWGSRPSAIESAVAAAAVLFKIQEQEKANAAEPGGKTAKQLRDMVVRQETRKAGFAIEVPIMQFCTPAQKELLTLPDEVAVILRSLTSHQDALTRTVKRVAARLEDVEVQIQGMQVQIQRMQVQIQGMQTKLTQRVRKMETRLSSVLDGSERRWEARFDDLQDLIRQSVLRGDYDVTIQPTHPPIARSAAPSQSQSESDSARPREKRKEPTTYELEFNRNGPPVKKQKVAPKSPQGTPSPQGSPVYQPDGDDDDPFSDFQDVKTVSQLLQNLKRK
jgi:TolA-binding protein